MKTITLRNIPPALARVLEAETRSTGTSLSRTVIRLLERVVGQGPSTPRRHHDLDDLAGTWTEREARDFDQALAEQRRLDPELWR